MSEPQPLRVVVAEDSALVREGLIRLLGDRGVQVAAAVPDAGGLPAAVAEHRPDAVVSDIRMPPTHTDEGLRAALALRARWPDLGVLLFSQYIETAHLGRLVDAGLAGFGYLLKDRVADVDEFLVALHRVAAGGTAVDPEVVAQLLASREPGRGGLDALTEREHEVLAGMARGRTNAGIAADLGVSRRAVEKHSAGIFTKLGLDREPDGSHRRVLAVLLYLGHG